MKVIEFSTKNVKLHLRFLTLIILLSSKSFSQNNCKEVIGYYPNWQWYDRNKLVNPESIDYSKYTIINYSFVNPLADGTITIIDPWADKNLLLGSINWGVAPTGYDSAYDLGNPSYHNPTTSLIHFAHINNTKVMISVGGWTLSDNFPGIAAVPSKRANFAHWCNQLVRVYNIDGIDIDWEYPGFADHGGTSNDFTNYTLLLQEIRDSLDFVEIETNKTLMLTAAFSADPLKMEDIDWDMVVPILDYINLMSYDFFGSWETETNHNSPLYTPVSGNSSFNCNSAVQRLINEYGVPSTKINLGVAFYGRSYKTNGSPVLHGPSLSTSDLVTFSDDQGTPLYYNILDKSNLFNYNWDTIAQVPYLTGNNGLNTFLSYDDERSIGLKGQYIVDNNLAGAIIWEITGDYIESSPGSGVISKTPLVDTLNLALCHAPSDVNDNPEINNIIENAVFMIEIFPNPTNGTIMFNYDNGLSFTKISVHDINGKILYSTSKPVYKINLEQFENGVYYICFESISSILTYKVIKQ